jgi:hypothetical protein
MTELLQNPRETLLKDTLKRRVPTMNHAIQLLLAFIFSILVLSFLEQPTSSALKVLEYHAFSF